MYNEILKFGATGLADRAEVGKDGREGPPKVWCLTGDAFFSLLGMVLLGETKRATKLEGLIPGILEYNCPRKGTCGFHFTREDLPLVLQTLWSWTDEAIIFKR